ncbi:Crp/Fnr family transcriptional regulator [Listeria kieliensis]|uniref:Crp/Fnr family transcriptional regulator n=1 Tax=Listeria kieliensis TaxID=1621700 RepID=A0A3D8TVS6_9LIST|nr:Crp/Fnr family transcriptional regulator [Listeria kieliensis]RDX02014.1 hypothetical protein UR08_00230 [Listeria kieliensis]
MIHKTEEFRQWRSIFWKLNRYENEQICYNSKDSDGSKILLVKQGTLLVQVSTSQDEKAYTEILIEGDIINVEALIEQQARGSWNVSNFIQYQVVAFGPAEVYEIDKEFLLSHLYIDPRKYHDLFERIIVQLVNISFASVLSNRGTQAKVSWALFRTIKKVGYQIEEDTNIVGLPSFATQTFIAQISHSGKARTNEAIKELSDLGIIIQWGAKCKLINMTQLIQYLKKESLMPFSHSII